MFGGLFVPEAGVTPVSRDLYCVILDFPRPVQRRARGRTDGRQTEMRESFDPTLIIFALVAIFVVWKLRSVLGQRTGEEKPPADPRWRRDRPAEAGEEMGKVIRLPGAANDSAPPARPEPDPSERWKGFAEPGSPVWAGLDAIAAREPFDARIFTDGAKAAYEMIVSAFAQGDRKALKPLLAKDVFDSFDAAIAEREQRGERIETTFVSIDRAEFQDVQLRGANAQITIRFLSKQINATRDRSGAVIDGDAGKVVDMVDVWTFARDVGTRDPNWKLVATEAGA